MSLTLLTRVENTLYIGADTRRSTTIDGRQFAVANDTSKIMYNDKFVIFGAGECSTYTSVFQNLVELNTFTIDDIVNVCRQEVPLFGNEKYNAYDGMRLALVVATFENDEPVYYNLFQINNFEPKRHILQNFNFRGGIARNIKDEEVYQWLNDYEGEVVDLYKDFFYKYQNESVGGSFNLFAIKKNGVFEVASEVIPIKKEIKWYTPVDKIYRDYLFNTFYQNPLLVKTYGYIYANNLLDQVQEDKIANQAVGGSKIKDSAVSNTKIANSAVTPAKLDRIYADIGQFNTLNAKVANIDSLYVAKNGVFGGTVEWANKGKLRYNDGLKRVEVNSQANLMLQANGKAEMSGQTIGLYGSEIITSGVLHPKGGMEINEGGGGLKFGGNWVHWKTITVDGQTFRVLADRA